MQGEQRFEDQGKVLGDFRGATVLVVCPQCGKCAQAAPYQRTEGVRASSANTKMTCLHCGFAKQDRRHISFTLNPSPQNLPHDPLLQPTLWLQIPCGNHVLWAYNRAHLEYLELHVQATLRQRTHLPQWQNNSLMSRLPRWMTEANHREAVLKAIQKLKRKEL